MTDASVNLWGRRIGAVSWDEDRAVGVYQYDPAFLSAGIEVSPFVMPVREAPYTFPALGRETFMGLPGPQMSLAGKRDGFVGDDVLRFAQSCGLRNSVAVRILDEVVGSVSRWRTHGADAGVDQRDIARVGRTRRTYLHRLSRRRAPP